MAKLLPAASDFGVGLRHTHADTHTHTHLRSGFVWADRLAAWVVSALIATDTVCASAALEWFGVNVNGCVSLLLTWAGRALLCSGA